MQVSVARAQWTSTVETHWPASTRLKLTSANQPRFTPFHICMWSKTWYLWVYHPNRILIWVTWLTRCKPEGFFLLWLASIFSLSFCEKLYLIYYSVMIAHNIKKKKKLRILYTLNLPPHIRSVYIHTHLYIQYTYNAIAGWKTLGWSFKFMNALTLLKILISEMSNIIGVTCETHLYICIILPPAGQSMHTWRTSPMSIEMNPKLRQELLLFYIIFQYIIFVFFLM